MVKMANLRDARLERMTERRMPDIMQKARRPRDGSIKRIALWIGTVKNPLRDVLNPN